MRTTHLIAALAFAAASAKAQAPAAPVAASIPSASAVRADAPPVIDGREDDAVWRVAPATSQFQEFIPNEGKTPRFKTEFRAAYDDRNLYVFVRAFDPHPDSIKTALTRRDVRGSSDQLKVMVDAYNDRRSGFEFAVNPVGVKRDYAMYNDNSEDDSWDGVWDVATKIDSLGWTAEFRIPFSQLRYANSPEHVFGFAIWRDIERYKERTSWPLYRPSQPGVSSQLGLLTGIHDIMPFRRRELVPYVVAKNLTRNEAVPVGSPPGTQRFGRSQKASVGADLKYGLTPNLTLDATVNPDFGQVEADPSTLNLTAFEQFFQERRPFFVEGSGIYSYSLNSSRVNRSSENVFYSRRIGRAPQLLGLYADESSSNTTPILGAGKLTGRIGSMNIGALEAVTGHVDGLNDRTTEPRTSYTVLRAQQDARGGRTSIGFIGTGTVRALDQWTDPYLRHDAYVAGTDLHHQWGANRYEINGRVTGSRVSGTAESIRRTQVSSVHLFQRPDDGLAVDPTRTSLTGDAEEINFSKMGGGKVRWLTGYERTSAGFETNDLGFLRRANQQTWKNWMGLSFNRPTQYYRQAQSNFNYQAYWTADGLPLNRAFNNNSSVVLPNNMQVFGGVNLGNVGGTYCDVCSRGGPAVRMSPSLSYNIGWVGDDRRSWVPELFIGDGYGERVNGKFRSHNFDISPSVEFRPLPQLQLSIGADFNWNDDDVQWLGNFNDAAGKTHYAFAHLDQYTTSLTTRASYAMTPTLTFQLYAAPFLSRGRYDDVRELSATPRAENYTARYLPYTAPAGTPTGFDVLELRSNSVLRWEFRPGSTLFAVWTHGRDGFDSQYRDRSLRTAYDDLFSLHPDNTFLVKLAYWIN